MSRRALVVEPARRPPGSYPINVLFSWAVVAGGCCLYCTRCGADARAPLPSDVAAYNQALEAWLAQHRGCA